MIAGGGTGGHLFPGIAVAEELRRRDANAGVLFVGSKAGIEVKAVPRAGFDLALIPVSGLRRVGRLRRLMGLLRLPLAMLQAALLVLRFRPQVALGCGGYAAGPAVLMAFLLGVPCAIMEQNAIPGLTNRLLGKIARRVFAGLPTTGFGGNKILMLGNPVRRDLIAVRRLAYCPKDTVTLLVIGGSQGARAINEAMMSVASLAVAAGDDSDNCVDTGARALRIVHQTGKADCQRVERAYAEAGFDRVRVCAFIEDMASAWGEADLVLGRAGATSIAEMTVCGRPGILVPFPGAVDDHQSVNARTLVAAGAAVLLPQEELTGVSLWQTIESLAFDRARLSEMAARSKGLGKPDAAAEIVNTLEREFGGRRQAGGGTAAGVVS